MPSHTKKERKKNIVAAGSGGLASVKTIRARTGASAAAGRVTATRRARGGSAVPFAVNRASAPPASQLPRGSKVKGRKVKRVTIVRSKKS